MRVKVLKSTHLYWNYGIVQVWEGEEISADQAAYMIEVGVDVEPLDDDARKHAADVAALKAQPLPDPDPASPEELDINANAADVLAWAGEDPERAAEALAAEQAKDKPRSTLVKQLEKLAGSGE
ncbi:hypothetical protein [Streptomyces sp. NPDC002758]